MQLNVSVILTQNNKTKNHVTAALEIGGNYSDTLPVELAKSMIALWGLKQKGSRPTTKLNNNADHSDILYS